MSKEKARKPKMEAHNKQAIITTVIEAVIIVVVVLVGMLVPKIFAGTTAADIISRTFSKFFDIGTLLVNNYIRIIETITILIFIWVLKKLIAWALIIFLDKKLQIQQQSLY
jgi:hypothetical protein